MSRLSRSLKVIVTDTYWSATYDFLLKFHSNHGPISYRFRDKRWFQSKIAIFLPLVYFAPPLKGFPLELGTCAWVKTGMIWLPGRERSLTISSAVWIQYTNDIKRQQRPHLRIASAVKTNFGGVYRLSGTGIVKCFLKSLTWGVIWNSVMVWPDWPWPHILRQVHTNTHLWTPDHTMDQPNSPGKQCIECITTGSWKYAQIQRKFKDKWEIDGTFMGHNSVFV